MPRIILTLGWILVTTALTAQTDKPVVPLMRQIFHDKVDESQLYIDKLDTKEDHLLNISANEEVNGQITYTLFNQVDDLQNDIEADNSIDGNDKIKFLRGLSDLLHSYAVAFSKKEVKAAQLQGLVSAFRQAMDLEKKNQSIVPTVQQHDLEVGELLARSFAFSKNVGLAQANDVLVFKNCRKNPDEILPILSRNPNFTFTDSLIKFAARKSPEQLYTYAQSTGTPLGRRIAAVDDSLVQMIRTLSAMNTGRLYFPFLDNLYRGKISLAQVEKTFDNDYDYYRLLVNTQVDYAGRLRRRDTPMVMETLTGMLRKKAVEVFINVVNGLHDSPDHIRMKKVEPLNPQELYYLAVMGETEIYTSSYLKVYDRIFQRMKYPRSDTLLMSVNFDHFKKFIKMAAGYNTLDNFLKRMEKENAVALMKAFVNGLEKTGNLEDAVDVADSYASISDPELRSLILTEVQQNIAQLSQVGDHRGASIYNIMNNIFLSIDPKNNIDISEKYGIPAVYSVPGSTLKSDKGRIIVQQFFYGDKDGNTVFRNFIGAYSNGNWRIVSKPEWIEVSSTGGTPITIYANRPLDETQDLDAKAQASLGNYLADNNLQPSIVIHRGHSYYVQYTIKQLAPSAKVVLLGSCGGYHNLHNVLKICPYAHIIASKQVGSGTVNQPMIVYMTEMLRQGKDLNWPAFWSDFGKRFKGNELFDDYVPPHKNLGAIFIMAYNKVEDETGE